VPGPPADTTRGIEAVNGWVTPRVGTHELMFGAHRILGQLGCNAFDIEYRHKLRRLVPLSPPVAIQRRRWRDMRFEKQGLALLSGPVALVAEAEDRLSLNNEAGLMTLKKVR
jgi:hypothetical protein